MDKKYQTSRNWSWKLLTFGASKWDKTLTFGALHSDQVVTNVLYTDVDLMSLFDKTLLHEVRLSSEMEAIIRLTKIYRCAILLMVIVLMMWGALKTHMV